MTLKRDVSPPPPPPVEPLNAERGKWALEEGGVVTDGLAFTPLGFHTPRASAWGRALALRREVAPTWGDTWIST